MADKKKSFILYLDNKKQLDMLTDEQAGKLIKALFEFADSGTVPKFNDGMLTMAFSFMSDSIARDSEKYKEICRRRSEYGKKGGRPKKEEQTEKSKKSICFSEKAKKADNDNDNDNENENENDNDNDNDNENENENDNDIVIVNENDNEIMTTTTTIPPDIEEVKEYCRKRGNKIDVEYFFDYYGSKGWKCGKSPMTDWKAVIRTWERRDSKPEEKPDKPPNIRKNAVPRDL